MSEPVKHHYVPSSYQELFRDRETKELYRLDKNTGRSERSNPKSVLYEPHLYTLENPPEGTSRTTIENPLLSKLDGQFKTAIDKISENTQTLDKDTLAICIAFLRCRTPEFIQQFGVFASDEKLRELYNHILSSQSHTQGAANLDISLTTFESFKESVNGITLSAGNDYNLAGFIVCSILQADDWLNKRWTLLVSKSEQFITSDKPVSAVEEFSEDEQLYRKHYFVPLSSRFCVKIEEDIGELNTRVVSDDEASFINMAVAYCANKLIIGRSQQILDDAHKGSMLED